MILDALTKMSAAQAITTSGASTSYIDTIAAGEAYNGSFVYFKVDTTVTSATTDASVTVIIQTSATSTFDSTTTLFQSDAIPEATLVAGYEVKGRLASGAKRYIRAYYTSTKTLTAGAVTTALVKDVEVA